MSALLRPLIFSLIGLLTFLVLQRYSRVPKATSALLAAVIAGYAASLGGFLVPSRAILYSWGSSLDAILSGRAYTLVTSIFLHAGLLHLAFNSYALYVLGTLTEQVLGPTRMLATFFAAALVGGLGSAILTPWAVSVGASGGILGLFGVAMILEWVRFGRVSSSTIIVAILAVGGGFLQGVDVIAHVLGLAVGAAMGWAFLGRSKRGARWWY